MNHCHAHINEQNLPLIDTPQVMAEPMHHGAPGSGSKRSCVLSYYIAAHIVYNIPFRFEIYWKNS